MALTLMAIGCDGSSSTRYRFDEVAGVRVELAPGSEVAIPIRLDAPGGGSTELSIQTSVVAYGSEPPTGLTVDLELGSGEIDNDDANPMQATCVGNCRGDHRLTLSLSPEATTPVAVDWSVQARIPAGTWDRDRPVLEAPSGPAGDWQVVLDSETGSVSGTGSITRLHLTGPPNPLGLLRLEVPAQRLAGGVDPVLVFDSSSRIPIAWGASAPLEPPEECGPSQCDWSLLIAAVTPWRIVSTSTEFDVSVTPLEEGVLTGDTAWRETVPAGQVVELTLDATTRLTGATDLRLDVNVVLWSVRDESAEPLFVTIGAEQGAHHRRTSQTNVLIPMVCGAEECRGSAPVVVDATSLRRDIDVELRIRASQAGEPPVAGQIDLEIHP
jgi:hypothetical protein